MGTTGQRHIQDVDTKPQEYDEQKFVDHCKDGGENLYQFGSIGYSTNEDT